MEKAKVYFTDLRTQIGVSQLDKLEKLIRAAGIGGIDFDHKMTAIKIHFGEPGNLAFLRPNYAKRVADVIKSLGGIPFLTDCNTLYPGRRKNALEHLDSAFENGYTPYSTGCQILIADGLKGSDDVEVPVPNGEYVQTAKIGRAIMDADIFISLSHFKGHELTGFGGAIKNIGMGCGSRAGKMEMHAAGKPTVDHAKCVGCGRCVKICAHDAPQVQAGKATIDHAKCVGCGRCIGVCPMDAITPDYGAANEVLNRKMAEYALAVLHGRPHFHVSLAIDVSPFCDCHAENDVPIVPDVGMFASFDPVAIDRACADAVNRQAPVADSILGRARERHADHFGTVSPATDWRACLEHAEAIGLGTQAYTLHSL